MALTEQQKTDLTGVKERLQTKYTEVNSLRNEIRGVTNCVDMILEEIPQDSDLRIPLSAERLEALRSHVISKADMLAPVNTEG